jgi:DNA-binding NarL/FixJ family response regulator
VERVRVVLAGLPRMLADIVHRVLTEAPDLEITHTLAEFEGLMDTLDLGDTDVVVTGHGPNGNLEQFATILRAHPSLRIFALEGDGRRAVMYELQPHSVPLGDVSPEGLIEAIRSTVRVRNG